MNALGTFRAAQIVSILCVGIGAKAFTSHSEEGRDASFRRIAIIDKDGRERLVLGSNVGTGTEDSPEIQFLDKQGTSRLTIRLIEDSVPVIYLMGSDGKPRARLGIDSSEIASLIMGVPQEGALVCLQAGGKVENPRGIVWAKDLKGHYSLNSENTLK